LGETAKACNMIEALITEARIDDEVYPTYYLYACPNGTHEFELTEVCNHCLAQLTMDKND